MARIILTLGPILTTSPIPHVNKSPAATFFPSRSSSSNSPALALTGSLRSCSKRRRGKELAVVRAGPPSTNSLILAFVLPFSLVAGTIFTSIRIAHKLDEKYVEDVTKRQAADSCYMFDLAMNQAMMEETEAAAAADGDDEEEEEEEEEKESEVAERAIAAAAGVDGDPKILLQKDEEVAAVPRARNRPRRGAY